MTPPPNQNPKQSPARRGRWLRKFTFLLFLFGLVGAGGWRYRVTRPEYRLARGQDAIRAGDAEKVRDFADRLEAAGHADQAHLLRGEALLSLGSPGLALDQLNKVASEGPIRLRAAALSGRTAIGTRCTPSTAPRISTRSTPRRPAFFMRTVIRSPRE